MDRTLTALALVFVSLALLLPAGSVQGASSGPSLTVTYPPDGFITRSSTVTVNGTTDGTSVTINGLPASLSLKAYNLQVPLNEGPNSLLVLAKDASGNTTSKALTVVKDTVAPVVSVTSPSFPLLTNRTFLHIQGVVEKGSSVIANGKAAAVSADTFSADVAVDHNVTALIIKATDLAGNERTVSYPVTFDDSLNLTFSTRFEHDYYFNYTKSKELIETYYDRIFIDGKTDPGASIIINGNPVKVLDNGSFTEMVELKMGSSNISIVAKDAAGNNVSDFINVKRYKYEPFLVPVEVAGMLLILGLIAGSVGGWFVGRHKERKVQAAAKQKAAEEAYQARKKAQAQKPEAPPKETKPKEPPTKKETKN
jgi:hypothetical protein